MTTWMPIITLPLSFIFFIFSFYWYIISAFNNNFKEAIKYLGVALIYFMIFYLSLLQVMALMGAI